MSPSGEYQQPLSGDNCLRHHEQERLGHRRKEERSERKGRRKPLIWPMQLSSLHITQGLEEMQTLKLHLRIRILVSVLGVEPRALLMLG